MKSHLQAGDELLSKAIAAAPLGDGHERKNRGRRQLLTEGGPSVRLLDIVGDDQLAQHMTVHGSSSPEGSYTPDTRSLVPPVLLYVSWGTDGAAHQAEVDLVQGCAFSVAASSLRVDAQIQPITIGEVPRNVICALSVGYYPSPGRAQRTHHRLAAAFDPMVPLASVVRVPVPPFAARLDVLRGGPSAILEVAFFTAENFGLAALAATTGTIDLPIPNGAAYVLIGNGEAFPVPVQAIFQLRI